MPNHRQLFLNLPVKDLDRSVQFFTKLGFEFDARFTDGNATCMIVGEGAFVMLLTQPFFAGFTSRPLADPVATTGAIVAVSTDGREDVDAVADAAVAAGATPAGDPQDQGFMYQRSFHDLDGHHWEVFHMDTAVFESGGTGG